MSTFLLNNYRFSLTPFASVCFAMITLYLSRRDQRRARLLRESTAPSEGSEDYALDDEADGDLKKPKRQVSEATTTSTQANDIPVPTLASEFRCASVL